MLFLGTPLRAFLEETGLWIGGLSRADALLQCEWTSPKQSWQNKKGEEGNYTTWDMDLQTRLESNTIRPLCSQAFKIPASLPSSPARRWQFLGLLSHHNHLSQFLTKISSNQINLLLVLFSGKFLIQPPSLLSHSFKTWQRPTHTSLKPKGKFNRCSQWFTKLNLKKTPITSFRETETWIISAWGAEPRIRMPPGFLSPIPVSASLRALALFSPLQTETYMGQGPQLVVSHLYQSKKAISRRMLAGIRVACPALCVWRWEYYDRHPI